MNEETLLKFAAMMNPQQRPKPAGMDATKIVLLVASGFVGLFFSVFMLIVGYVFTSTMDKSDTSSTKMIQLSTEIAGIKTGMITLNTAIDRVQSSIVTARQDPFTGSDGDDMARDFMSELKDMRIDQQKLDESLLSRIRAVEAISLQSQMLQPMMQRIEQQVHGNMNSLDQIKRQMNDRPRE